MPITERTLKGWRKEALEEINEPVPPDVKNFNIILSKYIELNNRILRMTQELLDAHLIRKK